MDETLDFDAAIAEALGEGATFKFRDRTWHLVAEVPMGTIFEVGKILAKPTDDTAALETLVEILASTVITDEIPDFRTELLAGGPVAFWIVAAGIMEKISGRPLDELLSSQQSASSTTEPSNNDSSTGDTTGEPSDSPPVLAST